MAEAVRVGFIGLGDQGGPIVLRMLRQGLKVCVWARRPEACQPFLAAGATVAETPAALAAACDVVGICVVNDDDVRQVVQGETGLLAGTPPGAVIAVHLTVAPQTVIQLAAEARAKGVLVLDAPVSGGAKGAAAGTMTVMVGGDPAALEIARPVFATFATAVPHLGPVGSGQLLKLLNNNLCYANMVMAIEALELAERLGVDPAAAGQILRVSSGASIGLEIVTDHRMLGKAAGPSSSVGKDVAHFLDVLRGAGLQAPGLAAVSATAPTVWRPMRGGSAGRTP